MHTCTQPPSTLKKKTHTHTAWPKWKIDRNGLLNTKSQFLLLNTIPFFSNAQQHHFFHVSLDIVSFRFFNCTSYFNHQPYSLFYSISLSHRLTESNRRHHRRRIFIITKLIAFLYLILCSLNNTRRWTIGSYLTNAILCCVLETFFLVV